MLTTAPHLLGRAAWLAASLRRFDLAAEFGVFAVVEYQSGQAKRLVRAEPAGRCNDDVSGGLDADDTGRAGPADDLRDSILLRCFGCGSMFPFGPRKARQRSSAREEAGEFDSPRICGTWLGRRFGCGEHGPYECGDVPSVGRAEPGKGCDQDFDFGVAGRGSVEDQTSSRGCRGTDDVQRQVEPRGKALQGGQVGKPPGVAVGGQVMHRGAGQLA